MGSIDENMKLKFEFSNTFLSKDRKADCPVFLRHRGIHGSLRVMDVDEGGLDKVKLILRGTREILWNWVLLLIALQGIW